MDVSSWHSLALIGHISQFGLLSAEPLDMIPDYTILSSTRCYASVSHHNYASAIGRVPVQLPEISIPQNVLQMPSNKHSRHLH